MRNAPHVCIISDPALDSDADSGSMDDSRGMDASVIMGDSVALMISVKLTTQMASMIPVKLTT